VSKTTIDDVVSAVPAFLLVGDAVAVDREAPAVGAVIDLAPASPVVVAVVGSCVEQVVAVAALSRAALAVALGC